MGAHRYALYLAVGGSVLPVVTADAVALPTAVRLGLASGSVPWARCGRQPWGVAAGDVVEVGDGRVTLPGLDVVAVRTWRPARVRTPPPGVGCSNGRQSSHLSTQLEQAWATGGEPAGGSHDGAWLADGIRQALSGVGCRAPPGVGCSDGRLGSHLSTQLHEVDAPAVAGLVGRGPGLTPAGDDALAGALLVAHALGAGTDLADAVRARLHATTAVSAALLDAAADGYAARPVVTLVDAAVANRPDAVARALPAVLAIGHTSGADTVTGIHAALATLATLPALPALTTGTTGRECGSGSQGNHFRTRRETIDDDDGDDRTECRMTTHVELRRGAYHDSVSLMQVSRAVAGTPGVTAAQVAMATELNVDVLTGMGFDVPAEAGPNDLVVAIRADTADGVDAGLAAVTDALAALRGTGDSGSGGDDEVAPRTLGSAAARSGATLAVISVPGQHAVTEAFDAIASGLSVMLFSDNVSVDDEVRLKDAAAAADVLVMGPDCGTAHVAGVALGFANVVRPGSVGIVAASGTGAQQVMCLLDAAGVGVSHCLGVGGRDLKATVAGRSTRQALRALADDPATETVIVVSKPPDDAVLADVEALAAELGLRVHWAVLGTGRPDLTQAVEAFLAAEGHPVPAWPATVADRTPRRPRRPPLTTGPSLRGLFCGGTLADEAMTVAEATLGGIRSNIAHSPELALGADLTDPGHVVIDFGDDGLTRGRAHPMIDPTLRLERIAREAADPTCGVLLLDLVLGHGAHPDPAGELADAVRSARATARADGRALPVVVSLTGTDADPQHRSRCAATLADAGASVFLSNAAATRHALDLLGSPR